MKNKIKTGIVYSIILIFGVVCYFSFILLEDQDFIIKSPHTTYLFAAFCLAVIFGIGIIDHIDTRRKRKEK